MDNERLIPRSAPAKKAPPTAGERAQAWLTNQGLSLLVITIFLLANVGVFVERYLYYRFERPDVFGLLGHGVTWARSCGAALKLCGSAIMITMLRNLLSIVRETWVGTYLPIFDKHIEWHKAIAWMIALYATGHSMAHYVNFYNLSLQTPALLVQLKVLPPGSTETPSAYHMLWGTLPGVTGHIIILCMILMYTTAVSSVRRKHFELFWYTHHLFIVFFFCICIHGGLGILEPANFWMWWAGPALLYLMERILRRVRGSQNAVVSEAIAHPSGVIELRIKKETFNYVPGQYVFINCPYIASQEWHPFTISSSPDEDFLSVHIKNAGDWTGALHNLFNPNRQLGLVQRGVTSAPNGAPILQVDGPYGAASEDVFKFNTVLLWAAGIGVTPMASILKFIKYKIDTDPDGCPIRKVHFFWITRDTASFEWFLDLLATLEERCPFLEINLFITQATSDDIRTAIYGANEGRDGITGLANAKTFFNRPNMDKIFGELGQRYAGQNIGCFFCGHPLISNQLDKASLKFTDVRSRTRFVYHKENF
jgi:predicted ferric reductase